MTDDAFTWKPELKGVVGQYRLPMSDLDMYIQPGGCLEFGQTDNVTGERDLVHFCPDQFPAILQAVTMATTQGNLHAPAPEGS